MTWHFFLKVTTFRAHGIDLTAYVRDVKQNKRETVNMKEIKKIVESIFCLRDTSCGLIVGSTIDFKEDLSVFEWKRFKLVNDSVK